MPAGRYGEGRARRTACHVDRACGTAYAGNEPGRHTEISRRRRVDTEGAGHLSTYFAQSADVAHLIQVALTPIFLISAIGVTLNVLTSRLARIVDRARALEERLVIEQQSARARDWHEQLRVLERRAGYIHTAITSII